MRILMLLMVLGLTNVLHADVTLCALAGLERSVEVIYSDPGQSTPCEVLYTKSTEGGSSTPWRAQVQGGYCEDKAAGLVARLVGWGWDCQSGQPEAVPSSIEEVATKEKEAADAL